MAEKERWQIPERIWQLGWVSFFADICSEFVYPVIPLFFRALGAPAAAMGAVEGAAEALVSFMKGASGRHSDVSGKRTPYIRWGYGLSAAGKPLLALATVWPVVLGGRLLDRFGKGIRTSARDALIADTVDRAHFGKAFGLHRAMDTAGALVGVVLALGFLALWPGEYRAMFLLAAIPGVISVLLVMKVREVEKPEPEPTAEPVMQPSLRVALAQMPPEYWRALQLNTLFALGNSSDTFLLLHARNLGLTDAQVILAYALFNVVFTLMAYPAGALSDRLGRWRLLGLGWLVFAGVYWGFSQTNAGWSLAGIFGLFTVYGVYIGFTHGVSKALVADHSPKELKGTAMGVYYFLTGFATLASSLVTGVLWDRYSPAVAFQFCALLAAVAAVAIPLTKLRLRGDGQT